MTGRRVDIFAYKNRNRIVTNDCSPKSLPMTCSAAKGVQAGGQRCAKACMGSVGVKQAERYASLQGAPCDITRVPAIDAAAARPATSTCSPLTSTKKLSPSRFEGPNSRPCVWCGKRFKTCSTGTGASMAADDLTTVPTTRRLRLQINVSSTLVIEAWPYCEGPSGLEVGDIGCNKPSGAADTVAL